MANIYVTDEKKNSYSVDVEQNDSVIFIISSIVSKIEVELIFLDDPNGEATVYTSIDDLERLRDMIENEDETGITWTQWYLGDLTAASSDKIGVGNAPLALKFSNDSAGSYTVRFNYRGVFSV